MIKGKKSRQGKDKREFGNQHPAFYVAIGFAAVFMVGVLFFMEYSAFFKTTVVPVGKRGQQSVSEKLLQAEADINAALPKEMQSMIVPSPQLLVKNLWVMRYQESGIAELRLSGDSFELVKTEDPEGRIRFYSRGIFKYDEKIGEMDLIPTKSSGTPSDIAGVDYQVLTMRPYRMRVRLTPKGDGLYLIAARAQLSQGDLHPLFFAAQTNQVPFLLFEASVQSGRD